MEKGTAGEKSEVIVELKILVQIHGFNIPKETERWVCVCWWGGSGICCTHIHLSWLCLLRTPGSNDIWNNEVYHNKLPNFGY